jgi:hypothetical protein
MIDIPFLDRLADLMGEMHEAPLSARVQLADAVLRLLEAPGSDFRELGDIFRTAALTHRISRGAGYPELVWTRLPDHTHLPRYSARYQSDLLYVVQMPLPSVSGYLVWAASVAGFPLRREDDQLMFFESAEEAMRAAERAAWTCAPMLMPPY